MYPVTYDPIKVYFSFGKNIIQAYTVPMLIKIVIYTLLYN